MARLTLKQQRERFGGLTTAEACALRDDVLARLDPVVIADARIAWQNLAHEAREGKGQPWQWPRHPEAVRFRLVKLLGDGLSVPDAIEQARQYAKEECE